MTKKFTVSYYDIVCMQKDVEVEAENREEALQIANFEEGLTMLYSYSDGGRKAAGFKGLAGDCSVRAIAIATEIDYRTVYDALASLKESFLRKKLKTVRNVKRRAMYEKAYYKGLTPDTGTPKEVVHQYLTSLGWRWVPTMRIGSGCKVHLKSNELPAGRIVCSVSKHNVAVIDGVIYDNHDCSRSGTRCVYGYFINENN